MSAQDRDALVLVDRVEHGIELLTLNRPAKYNALNAALMEALDEALAAADDDPEVRCVVVTGAGDMSYSTGLDMTEFAEWSAEEFHHKMIEREPQMWRWASTKKPTIAAVNGYAHGGGAIMATSFDFRIGCERTEFRFTAIEGNGVNNTWQLPAVCGWARAKEYIMTARVVPAEEAFAVGLLHHLVPSAELMNRSLELARSLAEKPRGGIIEAKRLLREQVGRSIYDSYTAENATAQWVLVQPHPTQNRHIQHWVEHRAARQG